MDNLVLVCNELLLGRKDLEETDAYADPGESRASGKRKKKTEKQEKNARECAESC